MLLKLLATNNKHVVRSSTSKKCCSRTVAAFASSASPPSKKGVDDLDESTSTWGPLFKKDKNRTYAGYEESEYELGKHRSNAQELVEEHDVIEVDGDIAVCDGGGGALGHPLEYIYLTSYEGVKTYKECIYCALKYKKKVVSH